MKFYSNRSVTSRDNEVLFSTGSKILNWKWTLKHTKIIYFQNQTLVLITNIYFVFELEKKRVILQKYAHFVNFVPPFGI